VWHVAVFPGANSDAGGCCLLKRAEYQAKLSPLLLFVYQRAGFCQFCPHFHYSQSLK
jgi:hypothetical protein